MKEINTANREKGERIMLALTKVNRQLIEEAVPESREAKERRLARILPLAACLTFAVLIGAFFTVNGALKSAGNIVPGTQPGDSNLTETEPETEAVVIADAEDIKPETEGAFIVCDNVVYKNETTADYSICGTREYQVVDTPSLLKKYPHDGSEAEILCDRKGCQHTNPMTCTAAGAECGLERQVIVVNPDGTDEEVVYYVVSMNSKQSGTVEVIAEYNLKTGKRRFVTGALEGEMLLEMYCNGKLYMTDRKHWNYNGGFDTPYFPTYCVDVGTGEVTSVGGDMRLFPTGIYDGNIYFLAEGGVVMTCKEDLSDLRELGKLGEDPTYYARNTLMSGSRIYYKVPVEIELEGDGPKPAMCWGGSRGGRFMMNGHEHDKLFSYDVEKPEAGSAEVAEGVLDFAIYGDTVYYTMRDTSIEAFRKDDTDPESGVWHIAPYTGGTIHCKNVVTGEKTTLFCGVEADVQFITYIDNERVWFTGFGFDHWWDGGYKYTGEWTFVYEIATGTLRASRRDEGVRK